MRIGTLLLSLAAGVATQTIPTAPPPAAPAPVEMAGMNHADMIAPKVPTLLEGYHEGGAGAGVLRQRPAARARVRA